MKPLHAQLLQLAQPPNLPAQPLSCGQPLRSGQPLSSGQALSSGQPLRSGQPLSSDQPVSAGHGLADILVLRLHFDGVVIDVYRIPLQPEINTCWGKRGGSRPYTHICAMQARKQPFK